MFSGHSGFQLDFVFIQSSLEFLVLSKSVTTSFELYESSAHDWFGFRE